MNPSRRNVFGLLAALPAVAGRFEADAQPAPVKKGLMLAPRSKLVMIGDSITDSGRARPVGEGRGDAIGRGYVMMVDALLNAVYPEQQIRVVNQGVSGNTVRDLKARWQTDVLELKPDWVSVMIGANDVWRQYDLPRQTEKHVLIDEYEKTLEELVQQTLPSVKGVILIGPFYLEPNRQDAMRAAMDRYAAAVKRIADRNKTLFVDTQIGLDEIMKIYYPASLNWDRIHPDHIAALAIARAFVNAIGFAWTR